MADISSKIDAAAEKAFAEAAEKKTAAEAKPVAPVSAKSASRDHAAKATTAKNSASRKGVKRRAPRAAEPISNPQTITQLKDKIMATTNTKTSDFAKTAEDAVAQLQTRAKAAYDKGAELSAEATAFHKGNFDALVESGNVLAAGMQNLGRTVVADAKSAAETVTADVKAVAAVKSPTELFQLQGEIARRNLDTLVAKASQNAEIMMKLANDMFAPLSSRASVAMERFNKAA